uniref:Putative tpa exp: secreted protein n=1 Tax=Amblyomma cajennense TaxID=34607 RepID=A0A023FU55_AMBCJ
MIKFIVLVLATVSYASSASVSDANTFVDTVFREKMPFLVKGSPRLFPYATIPDFRFKVFKTGLTNRDLKVNMTRGEIRGFDNALQRAGDCQSPFLRDGQIIISCNLAVRGLNVTFTALAKGDTLVAIWKTIWVHVTVRDTIAHFEASAPAGRDGTLRTFLINEILLDVEYDNDLSLNEARRQKFKEEISNRVKDELRHIFFNDYNDVLRRAVESVTFPRA